MVFSASVVLVLLMLSLLPTGPPVLWRFVPRSRFVQTPSLDTVLLLFFKLVFVFSGVLATTPSSSRVAPLNDFSDIEDEVALAVAAFLTLSAVPMLILIEDCRLVFMAGESTLRPSVALVSDLTSL